MFATMMRWHVGCLVLGCCALTLAADGTGPETEKRFPPLKVPPGFTATLFACDPLIEYPSAIALGPKPGSLFVAVDYMTGLGTEIVRRSEIRLIEDTDNDGYADRATVYADGFNSIEGLTFHAGAVYAMHAPFLTALRDTNADGKADRRDDLLRGLGLTPEENPVRLHCANGLVMGHDGWLYLALGDHGCDVMRPEGDRLVFHGGGILRCRPDGRDLHVFATGLRNIYDVALDDELNVFVRDNENDGGDYKIRVCFSFFGADHGYPYLYYEHPEEAMPPLADLGLGSSAGGLCYLETQFPEEYRGNLFFCEWGRSIVRYPLARSGSTFAPVQEIEFAAGADNDPYGFKPTDLVVERDGSLMIADWADGQRPKRGRGRIYRVQYTGAPASASRQPAALAEVPMDALLAQLNSPSYFERFAAQDELSSRGPEAVMSVVDALNHERLKQHAACHAIWLLTRDGNAAVQESLFKLAEKSPDPRLQAQAVRALADLYDPVLVQHRLDAGSGAAEAASRLAALAGGKDPRVVREIVVALGRLRWPQIPDWLQANFNKWSTSSTGQPQVDAALAHAAMQALRRAGNWPAVLKLLDLPESDPLRSVAAHAVAGQIESELADGLIARLDAPQDSRRSAYAGLLTRIYKRPGPWTYWGYRPAPRPPNGEMWERTTQIEQALDRVLRDSSAAVKLSTLLRMQREKVPVQLQTLQKWLESERGETAVAAILESLKEHPRNLLEQTLSDIISTRDHASANRLAALAQFVNGLEPPRAARLVDLAAAAEDGPVLAEMLRQLGRHPQLDSDGLLGDRLQSPDAAVRTAAVGALSELRRTTSSSAIRRLLDDRDAGVRRSAAAAMGLLKVDAARDDLLRLASDPDGAVRGASLDSLRMLREPRSIALALAALTDRQTHREALELLRELGGPENAQPVIDAARRDPAPEIVELTVRVLSDWIPSGEKALRPRGDLEREIATLQGQSGQLWRWEVFGPLSETAAATLVEQVHRNERPSIAETAAGSTATVRLAAGLDGRVEIVPAPKSPAPTGTTANVWMAMTEVVVPESTLVQFLGAGSGKFKVWLNGTSLFRRDEVRTLQPDSDRFDGTLQSGSNRLVVLLAEPRGDPSFQLRFRRRNSTAEFEQLAQAALSRPGNAERGARVFFDQSKAQCSKCHRIGEQGERIGPELTGIGARFSRIHLIESILEPSRTVAPGFQTVAVLLSNGRVVTGIRIAETETTLTLGDNQGQKHELRKAEIEQQQPQSQSIMPDGLIKPLTVDQFVDLIAFLSSQKEPRENRSAGANR
jgi:putative membrane-bound dehydrogenase-like protein